MNTYETEAVLRLIPLSSSRQFCARSNSLCKPTRVVAVNRTPFLLHVLAGRRTSFSQSLRGVASILYCLQTPYGPTDSSR